MDYTFYKAEDFVTDEYFIQWVKNPTPESNDFWNAWLSKNPHQESVVREARQIVLMLTFKVTSPPAGKFLEVWEKILDAEAPKSAELTVHHIRQYDAAPARKLPWFSIVAAASLMIAAAIIYVLMAKPEDVLVRTAFGESRTFFLPDSTKVTLNANSSLRYTGDFNESSREVWLTGEGFFSVVHKKDNQNFLVHTDEVKVEVLGTRFNVNARGHKSQVVLEEGQVKLALKENERTEAPMMMLPGDLVEVSKMKAVVRKKVKAENYSSWRENKLVFVGTTLEEIGQLLADNYNYQVRFKTQDIAQLQFTGSASVDNPQALLQIISKVFNLTVHQEEGRRIMIERNK